jgi:hypothetical protein
VERSTEACFKVVDQGVIPTETREILGMAAIIDHWLINASHICHTTQASQPIGDGLTSLC